jgi:electron transport complex protein RnfC
VKVFSFHGGIHPPENKKQSTRASVRQLPIPKTLVIPTQQHLGLAADPVVSVGDKVLKGQIIAEPVGRISASLHAPTSGTVTAIEEQPVPHASGLTAECIVIESDGLDQWIEHQAIDYKALERTALVNQIRQMGIAGMGGAGFPTDVKLNLGSDHIVTTLIINAAECEPYITADDMLMREHASEILEGIKIIQHLLEPTHTLIGIEDNKPNAIRALNEALADADIDLDLVVVPTKYPSGGERQLIQLLTGVEVPSGKIPADIGIVVQNVGTAQALHRAINHGEPLIQRIVTLTGEAVEHPGNFWTLIGTPFSDLLSAADLKPGALYRLVMGGPMMGVAAETDAVPVIKTTNCLIAATESEMPEAPAAQPCIRCGMCEQACPAQLLPQQLYWFAKGKEFEKAKNHNLFDCIECGACAYVCPSSIPLVQFYRFAKSEIRAEELEQRKADHARERFEARQARLEREAIEKAERRKARAAEAAKAQAERKKQAANEPIKDDSAALKTAAAVARTKLKKAEVALKNAQDKGLDGVDTLQATVDKLKLAANEAEQALQKSSTTASSTSITPKSETTVAKPDLKALKQQVSIMRTKLKKAEAAEEIDDSEIEALKTRLEEASKAHADADNALIEKAQGAGIDLKQLRIDVAMAKVAVTKIERAISKSDDETEQETLKTDLESAKSHYDQLESQLKPYE